MSIALFLVFQVAGDLQCYNYNKYYAIAGRNLTLKAKWAPLFHPLNIKKPYKRRRSEGHCRQKPKFNILFESSQQNWGQMKMFSKQKF